MTKKEKRAEWIKENAAAINAARKSVECPEKCRASCGKGRTCAKQSGPGWGWWVHAFKAAGVECQPQNYWSGSAPTPSTSINSAVAEYIQSNAPEALRR